MKKEKVVTTSVEETMRWARDFSKRLKPGDVIRLQGDLGSGKTVFVKGVAMGLGLKDPGGVKSPTFVIMHIYDLRVPLYHFDLYRLQDASEMEAIGFEDFLFSKEAITCVEWAERADEFFPETAYTVCLRVAGESKRSITVSHHAGAEAGPF